VTAAGRRTPSGETLRAVIFDVDGVLIDTEPVWRRVETEVFGSLGVHLSEDDCRETMGVRIDEVVDLWHTRRPWLGASREAVVDRIVAGVAVEVRRNGRPIDGALDAIAVVRRAGLACGLASSSPLSLIQVVMTALHITTEVDVVCSAEQEAHGKPAPDVYFRAASLLGIAPGACLAVEDSVIGVLSARAAGMCCVVVPDDHTATDPRLDMATRRLSSLRELDEQTLEELRAAYFA
jgi:beta-phosphoglucomutase-like phosphatase (HAD superfamily)